MARGKKNRAAVAVLNKKEAEADVGASTKFATQADYKRAVSFNEEEYTDLPPVDIENRKCHNVACLVLLLATWAVLLGLGIYGYQNGDPLLLVYGTDYKGELCGNGTLADRRYLTFPRLAFDVLEQVTSEDADLTEVNFFGVCVSECPKDGQVVCTDEAEEIMRKDIAANGTTRDGLLADCVDNYLAFLPHPVSQCIDDSIRDGCFSTDFNTTDYLFRCFPEYTYTVVVDEDKSGCTLFKNVTNLVTGDVEEVCVRFKKVTTVTEEEPTQSDVLFDSFNTFARVISGYLGDIYKARQVILSVGIGVSSAIGFVYVCSLWLCVRFIVWGVILGSLFFMAFLALFCYVKAGLIDIQRVDAVLSSAFTVAEKVFDDILDNANEAGSGGSNSTNATSIIVTQTTVIPDFIGESADQTDSYTYAAYAATAATIVLIIVICVIGPSIRKAITIFNEASHALRHNPSLLFLPPIFLAISALNVLFFLTGASYILTTGEIEIAKNVSASLDQELGYSSLTGAFNLVDAILIFQLLGFFWTRNFFQGLQVMTVSGVVCAWYWGGGKTNEYSSNGMPAMFKSFYVACRFHLGSIAFGGLLIAIVQVIRVIAAYISNRIAAANQDSRAIKILLMSVNCFLKCAERLVKFVSRNSYIMTAMYGAGFCTASKMAFFAILHNLRTVAAVTFLGDIIFRFGQLLVMSVSALLCWAYLSNEAEFGFGGENELTSFGPPIILVLYLSAVFSREILSIFDIAADTILLAYCQDKKRLDLRGTGGGVKASERMQKFIAEHEEESGEVSKNQKYMII